MLISVSVSVCEPLERPQEPKVCLEALTAGCAVDVKDALFTVFFFLVVAIGYSTVLLPLACKSGVALSQGCYQHVCSSLYSAVATQYHRRNK